MGPALCCARLEAWPAAARTQPCCCGNGRDAGTGASAAAWHPVKAQSAALRGSQGLARPTHSRRREDMRTASPPQPGRHLGAANPRSALPGLRPAFLLPASASQGPCVCRAADSGSPRFRKIPGTGSPGTCLAVLWAPWRQPERLRGPRWVGWGGAGGQGRLTAAEGAARGSAPWNHTFRGRRRAWAGAARGQDPHSRRCPDTSAACSHHPPARSAGPSSPGHLRQEEAEV